MKRLFQLTFLFLCLALSFQVSAQRYVLIEASTDPFVPKDIFPIIMGDTTAMGERTDANTIYQLQNGQVYVLSDRIESTGGWHIQIEAADLTDIDNKPVITRVPNASGAFPKVIYARGDLSLKNLWLITGEKGPLENNDWGQIRMFGENSTVRVSDCLIEKDRGGFLQLRANGVKCFVDRSVFRNGGNRRLQQGNGRGIDARDFQFDTLIVRNTIIHNIIDRVFRSQGGTLPHNHIEFDHCTVFNQAGRHGTFQFGRALSVKITNNLLINPNMMGTTLQYAEEQTQPDNDSHKVFTIDTLFTETTLDFASNNIFWTQDVLDTYAGIDTVSQVAIYSDLIAERLGDQAADTYIEDPVNLNSVPGSILQYVQDLYANPASEDMFDFIVEDIIVAGTAFDSGNLFDFSTFDPCYDTAAASATGDTGGGAIGAVSFCANLDEGEEPLPSVVEIIVNSEDHTTLEDAVIAAQLDGVLGGEGPFTVFAPTDAAFGELPDGTLEELLMNPTGDLANILKYHVLGAKVLSTDLSDGMTAPTLSGDDITVKIDENGVFINGALVSMADVEASNGVVHIIDAVLLPPVPIDPVRYVYIEPSDDPFAPKDIFPVIMGDTTETGARVNNNTIYQLENGQVYILSDRIESVGGWAVQIEAVDLENIELKPVITRIPNASGSYPKVIYARGDLSLKNLWMVTGEKGPLETGDWGQIRLFGENSRVRVEDCLIEKDRGGFLQLRANGVKCYMERSILRNGGNRRILQGNGRGIDARDFQFDTLIVKNTIIHNIIDRVFRSQGGTIPHNYIEFDHCTVFNQAGRHGTFQFGRALEIKITNNLLINPNMMGTTPQYTDEQTQPDNGSHKVFTIDTLYAGTNLTFEANNIFWEQAVLDVYAGIDSVSQTEIYSELILGALGDDAPNTYFQEVVTLANVPQSLLPYVEDLYANPASEDMFDLIVEDSIVAGTALDNGNLFNFALFEPCYSPESQSATAATDGGPVGAVQTCSMLVDVFEPTLNNSLSLAVQPNPLSEFATFSFNLEHNSEVRLTLYNMMGQEVQVLASGEYNSGQHNLSFNKTHSLIKGMYIARLQTAEGQAAIKVMIR